MIGEATSRDGVVVRYDAEGTGTPALIFVHGWACDRGYWAAQMRSFGRRHRVVAVDLGGHGASPAERSAWTMSAFGGDVTAVADDLGLEDCVLIGHSMGGDVILEAALAMGRRVRGLVWVDVYGSLATVRTSVEVDAIMAPFRTDPHQATLDLVRGMFLPETDPALVTRVATDMASTPPAVAVDALYHTITNEVAVRARLAALDMPIVSIHPGNRPVDAASLQRHGVAVRTLSDVGHFPMLEDPARFDDALAEVIATFPPRS